MIFRLVNSRCLWLHLILRWIESIFWTLILHNTSLILRFSLSSIGLPRHQFSPMIIKKIMLDLIWLNFIWKLARFILNFYKFWVIILVVTKKSWSFNIKYSLLAYLLSYGFFFLTLITRWTMLYVLCVRGFRLSYNRMLVWSSKSRFLQERIDIKMFLISNQLGPRVEFFGPISIFLIVFILALRCYFLYNLSGRFYKFWYSLV